LLGLSQSEGFTVAERAGVSFGSWDVDSVHVVCV